MKILTLNCGSSSIKFEVIETSLEMMKQNEDTTIVRGVVEKIGLPDAFISFTFQDQKQKNVLPIPDHGEALKLVVNVLTGHNPRILKDLNEIKGIGHRMVHGAETFYKSTFITPEVEKELDICCEFAPLHNPQNIKGYQVAKKFFPNVPHVAVFDTGFHHTIPPYAYMYPLPYEMYEKHRIRRYGFHGSSHRFVSARAAELLGKPVAQTKVITAHLGNGSSIAAINGGNSIDTSMGFTPLEGLMMGTRCGDVDPAVVLLLQKKENLTADQTDSLMNKKSGFLGVSGISNDLRDIEAAYDKGDKRAILAMQMSTYRLRKYIASYMAALGGADAIVFTGGIGERSLLTRELTIKDLDFMGVSLDIEKNHKAFGVEAEISTANSKVKIFVIPTNEELVIARDTLQCIEGTL